MKIFVNRKKVAAQSSKHNSAFSLIEVMVVAGLMSVVGLSITSVITNSTKSQKRIEQKEAQSGVSSNVRTILQNPTFCRNAFCTTGATCAAADYVTGLPTAPPGTPGPISFPLQGIQTFSGTGAASPVVSCLAADGCGVATPPTAAPFGTPVPGITGLFVYNISLDLTYRGRPGGPSSHHLNTGELVISYNLDPSKSSGGRPQPTRIPVIVKTMTGALDDCSAAVTELWKISGINADDIYYDFNMGEVGIGTNNPQEQLHVNSVGGGGVLVTDTTNPYVHLRRDATNEWFQVATAAGADRLEFRPGAITNAPIMSMMTTGNVGIGVAAPASRLDVNGEAAVGQRFWMSQDGVSNSWIGSRGTAGDAQRVAFGFSATAGTGLIDEARISTNGGTRVTVTNAGDVGIGVGAPAAKLDVAGSVLLSGAGTKSISTEANNALWLNVGGTAGFRVITNGTQRFDIAAGGTSTFSDSVTVSSGNLTVTNGNLNAAAGVVSANRATLGNGATTIAGTLQVTGNSTIPALLGNITHNGNLHNPAGGTITGYSLYQISDRTLKKDIVPLGDQSDILEQIGVYTFKYIGDEKNKTHLGVIAQDIQKLYPELVTTNNEGNLNVNYIELIPVLIKALQESNAEIKKLQVQQFQNAEQIKKLAQALENQSQIK